jgi:hypothetical protein
MKLNAVNEAVAASSAPSPAAAAAPSPTAAAPPPKSPQLGFSPPKPQSETQRRKMAGDVLRKNAEAVAATMLSAASKACQQQVKRVSSKQKEAPETMAATKEAEWMAEAESESLVAPAQSALARLEFRETRDMRKWGAGEWCGSIKALIRL